MIAPRWGIPFLYPPPPHGLQFEYFTRCDLGVTVTLGRIVCWKLVWYTTLVTPDPPNLSVRLKCIQVNMYINLQSNSLDIILRVLD